MHHQNNADHVGFPVVTCCLNMWSPKRFWRCQSNCVPKHFTLKLFESSVSNTNPFKTQTSTVQYLLAKLSAFGKPGISFWRWRVPHFLLVVRQDWCHPEVQFSFQATAQRQHRLSKRFQQARSPPKGPIYSNRNRIPSAAQFLLLFSKKTPTTLFRRKKHWNAIVCVFRRFRAKPMFPHIPGSSLFKPF